jgi:hypothetical protein
LEVGGNENESVDQMRTIYILRAGASISASSGLMPSITTFFSQWKELFYDSTSNRDGLIYQYVMKRLSKSIWNKNHKVDIEEVLTNPATILDLKQRFGVEAGLSDHTLGIVAPVVAVTMGARVIEKHFILDKSIGGPDASFSLDEKEFTAMVAAVRQAEKAVGKVSYELTEKVKASRKFARSLFVVKHIKKGETFTEENVRSIRPGYGLHPKFLKEILGKTASEDLERGTPLNWQHINK